MQIQFEYFFGKEAEQYSFYRVPKVLFTEEAFKRLSCEAKILYGLMLDRMGLSLKNRWIDEKDRVYIVFTVEETMEFLNCSRQKAVKNLAELDAVNGIGLIEKKRLGLGRPNVIYVKNFMLKDEAAAGAEEEQEKAEEALSMQAYENQTSRSMERELPEVPKSYFKKYENHTSGSSEIILPEVPKSDSNKTNINKTDIYNILSNPSVKKGTDVIEQMDACRQFIRENIAYETFRDGGHYDCGEVDELVELMVEVCMLPDDSVIRIAGTDKPAGLVKNRFMKLNQAHIQYAMDCLSRSTRKVGNIKAYLLTTLYNASMTKSSYYRAEVNHDMFGSG